jgi:hypothetical protein
VGQAGASKVYNKEPFVNGYIFSWVILWSRNWKTLRSHLTANRFVHWCGVIACQRLSVTSQPKWMVFL